MSWRLVIQPPGGRVWSVNRDAQMHHYEVARHRAAVREQAGWLARAERIPPLERARVAITVHLRGWRRADATNYPGGATVKAALDGLVDAGVVPSDRPEHMAVAMPVLAPLAGARTPWVVLEITEVTDGDR